MTDTIFKHATVNIKKLIAFGFAENGKNYKYHTTILDGQFSMLVEIGKGGDINTSVIDLLTGEPYTLHLVESASGAFVGRVRTEYNNVLVEIRNNCFEKEIFKSNLAREVIGYIDKTYGDKLEYLWDKFPDNAIARRKDNKKWYLAILTVSRKKLGFDSDELTEIIDLRLSPEEIEKTVDNKIYFAGYHMNKKHWYTICLDGSVTAQEIFNRIDISYALASKK